MKKNLTKPNTTGFTGAIEMQDRKTQEMKMAGRNLTDWKIQYRKLT